MIYEDIFREFEDNGIRYVVVGGVAVNLHGYVRLTVDLDIMVDLSEENLLKILQVMDKLGYTPRVPVNPHELLSEEKRNEWIEKKGAVVFTFIDPNALFRHIDIFLSNPMDFEKTCRNKEVIAIGNTKVPVASIDDLMKMKAASGRPRDMEDIQHLKRIKELVNSEEKGS
jgi:predicted nucleotidyltransferase